MLSNNRNLELVTYDNADGSHANLLVALRELNQRVEAVRKTITDNQTW